MTPVSDGLTCTLVPVERARFCSVSIAQSGPKQDIKAGTVLALMWQLSYAKELISGLVAPRSCDLEENQASSGPITASRLRRLDQARTYGVASPWQRQAGVPAPAQTWKDASHGKNYRGTSRSARTKTMLISGRLKSTLASEFSPQKRKSKRRLTRLASLCPGAADLNLQDPPSPPALASTLRFDLCHGMHA